jgi:hypothetical protein
MLLYVIITQICLPLQYHSAALLQRTNNVFLSQYFSISISISQISAKRTGQHKHTSLFSKKRIVYCVYRTKKVTSTFRFLNSFQPPQTPFTSPSPSPSRPIRYTIVTLISHISIMKNYKTSIEVYLNY